MRRHQESASAKNRAKTAESRVQAAIGKSCPVPWSTCKECGAGFPHTRASRAVFCTVKCRRASENRYQKTHRLTSPQRRKLKPETDRPCGECGGVFTGKPGRKFCKPEHAAYFHRHANNRMRRVVNARRGGKVELVFRLSVFDRDGWRCQLCRRKVKRVSGNLPMGPTLDHIIPVARGGDHTYDNVQLAHRACNMKKRTGAGQLRLTL